MTALELERVRPLLESEIERLIGMLDFIDDDPDVEIDDEGEPWLGAPNERAGSWSGLTAQGNDDREDDDSDREPCCEDEGAQCDEEYDFGWTERESRDGSARYLNGDAAEPDLGSINSLNQIHWACGRTDDSEEQCDDEGNDSGDHESPYEQAHCYAGPCSPISATIGPQA